MSDRNSDQTPPSSKPSEKINYVNLYESENKIYARKITGFFQNIRRYTGLPLIAGYILLPWILLGGEPAILFDLPARKFHILGVTFWPQDFMLLAWLLIISAFSLFTVTVLLGRVWCGFTCPQTVWTLMFISVARFFEGDRSKQMKLDKQPWNAEKILKKTATHSTWLLIAFITGLTFVGYFVPIRELILGLVPYYDSATGILSIDAPPSAVFWVMFFTVITYLNAGWLREQVCKYMCPYARFQSVMYDQDTLAVHYDVARGEPRGSKKPNESQQGEKLGDCIDCSWCVQVCPVDIDIRDGLQYDCINCGLCVDACNAVMDKVESPRGLIRFTSEDELKTGKTHFVRPRLFGYALGVMIMMGAFTYTVATRTPLSIDVIRDRSAQMFRITRSNIQNVYTVKINNMTDAQYVFDIKAQGDIPFNLRRFKPVLVESGEVFSIPIRVVAKKNSVTQEKYDIEFIVTAEGNEDLRATETSTFIGPQPKGKQ